MSDFSSEIQQAIPLALAEAQRQRSSILGMPHYGCFLSASSRRLDHIPNLDYNSGEE